MKGRILFVIGALLAAATPVLAQDAEVVASPGGSDLPPPAASKSWEIGFGLGYSQGVGDIGGNDPTLTDLSHAGGELQLNIGYRIDRNWMVGVYGSVARYSLGNSTPDGSLIWSGTAGVQANYHIIPDGRWDPWIGLGSGWHGHWVQKHEAGTDSRQGLDLARLQVGVDYRVSTMLSVSPYIGASATMFLTQQLGHESTFSNISDPNVNFFFFGGLMGRFDVFPAKSSSVEVASNCGSESRRAAGTVMGGL